MGAPLPIWIGLSLRAMPSLVPACLFVAEFAVDEHADGAAGLVVGSGDMIPAFRGELAAWIPLWLSWLPTLTDMATEPCGPMASE